MPGHNIIKVECLNNILKLYTSFDKEELHENTNGYSINNGISTIKKIGTGLFQNASAILYRKEPTNKIIEGICDQVSRKINAPNKSSKDWLEFCYFLGEKAAQAQKEKTIAEPSRSAEILHCIRNMIITMIKNDEGDYNQFYQNEIKELTNEIIKLEEEFEIDVKSKLGERSTELVEQINKANLKLAFLEDPKGSAIAHRYRLIEPHFNCTEREDSFKSEIKNFQKNPGYKNNAALPYVLQEDLAKIHYSYYYQDRTKISFEEFLQVGIPEGALIKINIDPPNPKLENTKTIKPK